MPLQEGYSPRNRAERVISAGRLFLASLLAIALASHQGIPYPPAAYTLTVGYLLYSGAVAILTWSRGVTTRGVPLATHVIDLICFSILMLLTDGPGSPFFVYFVFATIC